MNMISTGAFLNEMNASDKQKNSLVSKLVNAWERKNSKTARAGGVSLMALSLAACGSSDDSDTSAVSYTQAQLDAAEAAATAAAQATAAAAAVTAAANAAAAQTAAVAAATAASEAADAVAVSKAFTANLDNLIGGTGDDSFNGVYYADGGTGTTAFPGDIVNGGAGVDTVNISVAGTSTTAQSINAISTTGVEKVFITNYDANADDTEDTTIDTSLMTGLTTVGVTASNTTDTIFSNVSSIVDVEMRNGSGDLTMTYLAAAVVGTTDTQNVTVSNNSAGTLTADGAETIAITAELAASTLAGVASSALKKVSITGDQNLTITAALDFAANGSTTAPGAVIDASGLSGKLTLTTTASENLSLTGGSGADTFNLGSLVLTDTVVGGAGSDTIKMDAAAITTQFTKVSEVENVAFNDSGAAVTIASDKLSSDVTGVSVTLKDDATGADNLLSTISGLSGQAVTITRADEDADVDGQVDVTLTGATDTASDTATVIMTAVGSNGDEVADTDGDEYGMGILNVANFETVNITSNKNAAATITTNDMFTLTASSTKSVVIDGAADMTIGTIGGGAMTSLDASAMTGALTATLAGDKVAVSMGSKNSTINFGTTFNNDDSVTGGAGTGDTMTATVTGLTATTGKLTVANVENINLTTSGDNTIDASLITGASSILAVTDNKQTITNLDLAQTVQLGLAGDESATSSEIDVTAASATGTSDTLKVKVNNDNGAVTSIVDASAIETLALTVTDADNAVTLDLTTFEGDNITVASKAGVTSTSALALGTLHKNTETVTSTYADTVTVSFANATNAATFSGNGTDVQTVTGSNKGDTVTIGSTGNITHVVTGGTGTDTTNMTAAAALVNLGSVDTENVNLTITAGVDVSLSGATFNAGVDTATLTGGNSLSTFTSGTMSTNLLKLDASGFGGNIVATIADDALDTTTEFTAGALATDEVSVTIANAATTYALKSTGVEILRVDSNAAAATTVSVSAATGLKTIEVDQGANVATQTVTISNLTGSETVELKASDDATAGTSEHILAAVLADATGTADTIGFKMGTGTIDAGARLQTADIETVSINADNAATIDLTNLTMTAATGVMTVNVTGDTVLTIAALNADVTTLDASGMATGGSVVQSARAATTASTVTGSAGADTLIHNHGGDVMVGGAGTDTLDVNKAAILGGINVDLTSATDQIVSYNGSATSGTVTGFENVDLSGYTGSYGAEVTGTATVNVVTGTANADEISLGAGGDTITYSGGDDQVTMGAGADTINMTEALLDGLSTSGESFNGGADSDNLNISTAGTGTADADFTTFTNMEKITVTGTTTFTINDIFETAGFNTIDYGAGAVMVTASGIGSASDITKILNYTSNTAAEGLTLGGTAAAMNTAITGWTVATGVYTKSGATVSDFYTDIAGATNSAGDVALFVNGGHSYIWAEGAATGATDDSHFVIDGVALSDVVTTAAAGDLLIA
jgi:hypothetical protein